MRRHELLFGAALLILGLACSGQKTNGADSSGLDTAIHVSATPGSGSSLTSNGAAAVVTQGSTLALHPSLSLGSGFIYAVLPSSLGSVSADGTFTASGSGSGYISVTWASDTRYSSLYPVKVVAAPSATFSASTTSPAYSATNVTVTPTWSGGTTSAAVGTTTGGSDISSAAASGTAIPVQATGFTTAKTYYLRVINDGGATADYPVTITPQTVAVGINPSSAVMTVGHSATFTATSAGGSTGGINWSASGGSVSSGVYTAPSTPGTYTVVATSADDPSKSSSASVTVCAAPTASLAASNTTPGYNSTSVTITPTFTGGTAIVGTIQGGSDISASATSGTAIGVQTSGFTTAKTYYLRVTNAAGSYVDSPVAITPQTAAVGTVSPATATLSVNGTQTFSATATGGATNTVTWSATGGTITSGGLYTAPATAGSYTITATSADDTSKTSSTTVTVVALPTATFIASATSPLYKATNVTVTPVWSGGTTSAKIGTTLGGSDISASAASNTAVAVQSSGFTTTKTYYLRVTNAAGSTADYNVIITPQSVSVGAISPATPTITVNGPKTFTATATGGATNTVTWSATGGTITSGGVYTAPATAGSYTITATSADDTSKTSSTTVTVVAAPTASLAASTTTPGYNSTSVTITPTFTGGTAIVGTTQGGSDISTSATSGTAIGVQTSGFTTAKTYYLRVTNAAGSYQDASVTVTPQSVTVASVTPTSTFATVSGSKTFSTTATGGATNTITWSATGGTITSGGVYTAPATTGTYTVTATSADDATKTSTATVTVVALPTATFTASTTSPLYKAANVTVTPVWSGGTTAAWIGTTQGGNQISPTAATNTAVAVQSGGFTTTTTYYLRVTNAAGTSADYNVTITPQTVSVSNVSPSSTTMAPGTQAFSATVSGGATNSVTWTATGGGSFSSNTWTSPTTPGTYTITATSVDDASKYYSVTMTISAPVISTQPKSQNICANSTLTLSVSANYADAYQWYKGSSAISSATSSTYSVSSATSSDSGDYTCKVSNGSGANVVTSGTATIVVGSSITSQPQDLSAYVAQTATFSVAATGKSPFSYQWYKKPSGSSASAISGATSSVYTTGSLSSGDDQAQFYAEVTDACSNILTSSSATLSVSTKNVPPTILTQPAGVSVTAGNTASLSVTATGSGTLSYQWYRIAAGGTTGSSISNATGASYTIPSTATTTSNDQDQYYVVVTNSYGQASSVKVTLAVDDGVLIQITGQPSTVYVGAGADATYTITASSTATLSYQWYKASPGSSTFTAVSGATSATYTATDVAASDSGSVYYCKVSNGNSSSNSYSVKSSSASLFVGALGTIGDLSNTDWVALGNATITAANSYAILTPNLGNQKGSIVWPKLIATGDIQLSFTVDVTCSSSIADGFCVVLADPSLGATTSSTGLKGQGLGAEGIPGFVLAFDTYYNSTADANGAVDPSGPSTPFYLGVGRGETALWEQPWTNVNANINALAATNSTKSHIFKISIVSGEMSVTMDGSQVFSGPVEVPSVAYLMLTASTGGSSEQVKIYNLSATVSAPSK